MGNRTAIVKVLGELLGAVGSAVGGILAVGESAAITTSAIVAVLGFGGLLVRQILAGQRETDRSLERKDRENELTKDELHYVRWELESMRYRHGERAVDPGPFVPRRQIPPPAPPAPEAPT